MQKSISMPNLPGLCIQKGKVRKSVSTNAISVGDVGMSITDAIIVSKAPINQSFECLVTNDFPDNLIHNDKMKINKDTMICLMTSSEPLELESDLFISKFQDEFFWERYNTWHVFDEIKNPSKL